MNRRFILLLHFINKPRNQQLFLLLIQQRVTSEIERLINRLDPNSLRLRDSTNQKAKNVHLNLPLEVDNRPAPGPRDIREVKSEFSVAFPGFLGDYFADLVFSPKLLQTRLITRQLTLPIRLRQQLEKPVKNRLLPQLRIIRNNLLKLHQHGLQRPESEAQLFDELFFGQRILVCQIWRLDIEKGLYWAFSSLRQTRQGPLFPNPVAKTAFSPWISCCLVCSCCRFRAPGHVAV